LFLVRYGLDGEGGLGRKGERDALEDSDSGRAMGKEERERRIVEKKKERGKRAHR